MSLSILLFAISLYFNACDSSEQESQATDSVVFIPEPSIEYGIIIDSFSKEIKKVKRDDNLASIFYHYNLSSSKVYEIALKSEGVFNPKHLVRNKPYTVYCTNDSINKLCYLIYEENDIDYIVFDLFDSVRVYKASKVLTVDTLVMSGIIESSLYNSILDQNGSPLLVNELADIFGWVIDFFHLYKGDEYKIIYESYCVEGTESGVGKILGAYFKHENGDYYGIYYEQDSISSDYYDTLGNSLQRSLLKYPIKFSRISSRYSGRRYHPVQKRYKAHLGTDFAAPRGTPIRSTGNGTVVAAGYTSGNGNYVKVRHNGNYTTGYLHMTNIAKGVRKGATVKQGQVIGYVGSTGLATGPHLCYRFWKHGVQVDALKVKLPPAKAVYEEKLHDYYIVKERVKQELDNIKLIKSKVNDSKS